MKTTMMPLRTLRQAGFTLVEMLIVTVIIGVLASIGIPKFSHSKDRAYLAAMKTDLRNLVTAQEEYYFDNLTYTNDKVGLGFIESSGVTVTIAITMGPPVSYGATAVHVATVETCAIYINEPAQAPAANEGEAACT